MFIYWKLSTLRHRLVCVHLGLWPYLNLGGVSTLTNILRLLDKTANYYGSWLFPKLNQETPHKQPEE